MGVVSDDAEDELVFDDDELTSGAVASAAGVREPLILTRLQSKSRSRVFDVEVEVVDEEERDLDGYNYGENGSEDENIYLEFEFDDF